MVGDCREKLRELPDASVNCCVTSPPYFGLRDYGTATWAGGDANCGHELRSNADPKAPGKPSQNGRPPKGEEINRRRCRCGATRVDQQMGLEPTPDEFVAGMVGVFREVRRVLRDDGTLWLNIGDSYAGSWGAQSRGSYTPGTLEGASSKEHCLSARQITAHPKGTQTGSLKNTPSCKAKDLIGIPWMLAFALRADGWYLRQDIIWSKPNPMPESVRDRCTKAHEYLFLLSKGPRYYFDADGIREDAASSWDPDNCKAPDGWDTGAGGHGAFHRQGRQAGSSGNKARKPGSARGCPEGTGSNVCGSVPWEGSTRNKRSVWDVATQPFSEAHFATFPPALIEPCILAGCPAGGTVLDPFFGAGTTGLVADRMGRDCIGIELNSEYAALAQRRIEGDNPMFAQVAAA
jgi:DNA modification methylase